jgi:hypothetical protein
MIGSNPILLVDLMSKKGAHLQTSNVTPLLCRQTEFLLELGVDIRIHPENLLAD